jgi:AcrR family transcriptional regulator
MRKRKPGRLRDIGAAALAVFTRQGFRLTQMADVAREAGISVGALYSYVDGKEALLELAFAQALGEVGTQDEPFRASGFASAGSALAAKLATSIRWPVLKEALERERLTSNCLAAVVGELFTVLTQHRHLFWLLDRCAVEVAELAGLYETAVRGRYFADFTRCIGIILTGRDLANEEIAALARALFEMVAWMSMHRHRDRQPPTVNDDVARRAVIEITLRAVLVRNSLDQETAISRQTATLGG